MPQKDAGVDDQEVALLVAKEGQLQSAPLPSLEGDPGARVGMGAVQCSSHCKQFPKS